MLKNKRLASFVYDGRYVPVSIDILDKTGKNEYSKTLFDNLLVTLKVESKTENSLDWTLYIKNTGSGKTGRITALLGMDTEIPVSGKAEFNSITGDHCSEQNFLPVNKTLFDGTILAFSPLNGRSSQVTAFPYFDVTGKDKGFVGAIGWTGQWDLTVEKLPGSVVLKAGQEDCDMYLLPGEEIRSTRSLLYFGSPDRYELTNGFRQFHKKYYSPAVRKGFRVPIAMQCFDRYFWGEATRSNIATEQGQLAMIDRTIKTGLYNTYWIDACWFRDGFPTGVGNYAFCEGFPEGLKNISRVLHEHGMKFIVWFEPERIDIESDTYTFAKDKPGWILQNPPDHRNRIFNMGNDEARKWLARTIGDFIEENGIDCYRQDFNADPLEFWRAADPAGQKGITENKYITGLYKYWDELLERFPELYIDNCASGGRRNDLETMSRAMPMWQSDTSCSGGPQTAMIHQNENAGLHTYLPFHTASCWWEKAYEVRSAMTSGIIVDYDMANPQYEPMLAENAMKEVRRLAPFWDGRYKALTDICPSETVGFAYQLIKNNRGCVAVFRRAEDEEAVKTIRLVDLEPRTTYRVTFIDETYKRKTAIRTGKELMSGIRVELPEKRSSLIIEFRPL
ncbi:MAG: alpha-galactosidase [Abditibacteriota bacterium]|nr:alpha-galactosidase [Abditibacteriota bacterium]